MTSATIAKAGIAGGTAARTLDVEGDDATLSTAAREPSSAAAEEETIWTPTGAAPWRPAATAAACRRGAERPGAPSVGTNAAPHPPTASTARKEKTADHVITAISGAHQTEMSVCCVAKKSELMQHLKLNM